MMREEEVFRFETKSQYERAIVSLNGRMDDETIAEEYDALVEEYIRFCELKEIGTPV